MKIIEYASDEIKEDIEVAKVAIQNNENAFRYLGEKLRSNRKLLLMAVKQNGELLHYASKELKNDKIVKNENDIKLIEDTINSMQETIVDLYNMRENLKKFYGLLVD